MGYSASDVDYYHCLERQRIHLLLIDDARRGLADVAAGQTYPADAAIAQLQHRRANSRPDHVAVTASSKRGYERG